MALTKTTLAAACAATDIQISVTSAASFAANQYVLIDQEWFKITNSYTSGTIVPVLRGQNGSTVVAHVSGANVVTDVISSTASSDWANAAASVTTSYPLSGRARVVTTYSASGAITIPAAGTDTVAVLAGTNALAMTLAAPTYDMDGVILTVIGNGKAAHTLTVTGGFGLGSTGYTVGTFDTNAQCSICLMACGVAWVPLNSPLSGTLTGMDVAIS